ncbi:MAG: M23 family peptidase [Oceanospirillaceae bacterium]|jgi:murein DD-endopeptidase MepM/ murein hydrolase activator NlpD|uniref:M23 family metallopeptidase n=1 Tax=Marinobacterium litorale TaxID=404770 RepID=UPI00042251A4|nr:M23 family metallopeptidase [Marinobacterium litorale]MBS97712.1 M23 family peptidase [Oceanospirillaceae bacterium]
MANIRKNTGATHLLPLLLAAALTTKALASQSEVPADAETHGSPATNTLTVSAGDTLESLLDQAGLSPELRREATLAIEAHYDVTKLSPGQTLRFYWHPFSSPRLERIEMTVEGGAKIAIDFSDTVTARRLEPELENYDRTAIGRIDGSLYDTLAKLDAPQRFAVDLPEMLGNLVAFNRDLRGGEPIALVWREQQSPDGVRMGDQLLRYVRLELTDRVLEIVLDADEATAALIYQNGKPVRRLAKPVTGARLSSVFGKRLHPVFGTMRMHTGVDYAASRGTPVRATSSGRIAFMGRLRGYGRVVDIDHGNGTITRYAHLAGFAAELATGRSVIAGSVIGRVGASGTATGPNLHYEVRLDGQPVDPLSSSREIASKDRQPNDDDRNKLQTYRFLFPTLLADSEMG